MNNQETECDAKCKQYTINALYTIGIDNGENWIKTKGDCPKQVHSKQMVLGTVNRRGAWTVWMVPKDAQVRVGEQLKEFTGPT
jgi:hypothetical protein